MNKKLICLLDLNKILNGKDFRKLSKEEQLEISGQIASMMLEKSSDRENLVQGNDKEKSDGVNMTETTEPGAYQIMGPLMSKENKSKDIGRPARKMIDKIRKNLKYATNKAILIIILLLIASTIVYFNFRNKGCSPYKVTSMNTHDIVKFGQKYAYALLENYPWVLGNSNAHCLLSDLSIHQAKTELNNKKNNNEFIVINEVERKAIIKDAKNNYLPEDLIVPMAPKINDLELIGLERFDNNIIKMDFVYQKRNQNVKLSQERSDMIFSITAGYYYDTESKQQYWMVSDYKYDYNINDYFNRIQSIE